MPSDEKVTVRPRRAGRLLAGVPPTYRREVLEFLRERIRLGLMILLLAVPLFGAGDLLYHHSALAPLLTLKVLYLAALIWGYVTAGRARTWRALVGCALLVVLQVSIITVLSDALVDDVLTTYVLVTLLTVGAAGLLPWGPWPQLVTVAITLAAAACHVLLLAEPLREDYPPAVACALAAITSIAVAAAFERHRLARHEIEQSLIRARDKAEAAARAKTAFLAMVSHELRTPLHGIFGMTEMALDAEHPDERRDLIERARACARTLLTIVNDVLEFSRLEAGRTELERTTFVLRDVVEAALDTFAVQAEQKGLELIGCVDDAVPARVCGDPNRLRQVLVNLVGNAIKFTQRGQVLVRLTVDGAGDDAGDTVRIRGFVRDSGIGIPKEKRLSVFEAFTQAEASTPRRFGGAGLGLAITRRLLSLMGGTIAIDDEVDRGTCLRFSLQLGRVGAPAAAASVRPGGLRVVVVDDNGTSRRHLLHTLRDAGHDARAAAGQRLLSLVRNGRVDAVVVNVAGGRARAALERLRARRGAAVRVVALVGVGTGNAKLPADVVVGKPVKRAALLAALAGITARTPDVATRS